MSSSNINPLDANLIPSTVDLIEEYRLGGGRINTNMSDLYPSTDMLTSNRILRMLEDAFVPMRYVQCFNQMLNGDLLILFEFIQAHFNIVNSN